MKTTLPIAGLDVHIHTQSDVDVESTAPAAVVFLLHGRLGNAQSAQIDGLASSLLNYARNRVEAGENQAKELIVVTFDHRNHGSRLVNDLANQGWAKGKKTHNERHAIDMFAVYAGTSRDVSFLIDFLPAYLYPSGEREVVDWGVIGISLGGHSTWMILKEDPRVTLGIPIIGCPDYLSLMEERARKTGMTTGPPVIPDSLRSYIVKHSPTSSSYNTASKLNPFLDKEVLVLSGASDRLVPWSHSEPFIDALVVGDKGRKKVVLQEGAGHELTADMHIEAATFAWEWIAKKSASTPRL